MRLPPTECSPDNWIILEITPPDEETFYKVLAGWSGGYLDGDSWRMNSGIAKIKEDGDYIDFISESGSIYHCHKDSETLRMNTAGIFNQVMEKWGEDVVRRVDYSDVKDKFSG